MYDGKRPEKIEYQTQMSKNDNNKKEKSKHVWRLLCQPAEESCFRSSGSGDESVAEKFFIILKIFLFPKNHQNQPMFIKLTCSVQAS